MNNKPTQTIIDNFIGLLKRYCPNFFLIIPENEYIKFVIKSYQFVELNDGRELRSNFLSSILELGKAHSKGETHQFSLEFGYLNHLFSEAAKNKFGSKFKDLLKGSILNFSDQFILDVIGELGACARMSEYNKFENYEHALSNGKSIDFVFTSKSTTLLIEVLNIKLDSTKYEKDGFNIFLSNRVINKHANKSVGLDKLELNQIFIFPVIHGLTFDILKEQNKTLEGFRKFMKKQHEINTIDPHTFAHFENGNFQFLAAHEII